MAILSVSKAWDETRSILARDGRLIVTIALALIVLPAVISDVASGGGPPAQGSPLAVVLFFLALIVSLIGQLAIQWLSVSSGTQVGDALKRGLGRAPVAIAALLLILIPASLVLTPVMMPIMANPENPPPGSVGLLFLAILIMLIPGARLALTSATIAAEDLGPIKSLKRSWNLTKGSTAKLYGLIILILIAVAIISYVTTTVVGSIVIVALGTPAPWNAAALAGSLVGQLIMVAVTIPLTVLFARIYGQLATPVATVPDVSREA